MEVGVITTEQTEDSLQSTNPDDSNEVFTYKHERGDVVSARVGELALCPVFRNMPEEQRAMMARMYNRGMSAMNEIETENGIEEPEVEEEKEAASEKSSAAATDAEAEIPEVTTITAEENVSTDMEITDIKPISGFEISAQVDSAVTAVPSESTASTAVKESDISSGTLVQPSEAIVEQASDSTIKAVIDQSPKKIPELRTEVRDEPARIINDQKSFGSGIEEPDAPSDQMPEREPPEQLAEIERSSVVSETDEISGESEKLPNQTLIEQDSNSLEPNPELAMTEPTEAKAPEVATVMSERADDMAVGLGQNEVDPFSEPPINMGWEEDDEINVFNDAVLAHERFQTEAESLTYGHIEFKAPEPMFELSVPLEEIDYTVSELAERIEVLEDEERQAVYEILDKIIAKSEEIAAMPDDTERQIDTVGAEEYKIEELKELFIELFDQVDVAYTPELLESFAKLASRGNISEFTEAIKSDEENEMTDRGTHEAITKLLAAVSRVKRAVLHAYNIGRSMLRLYSQQMAAST